VARLFGHQFFKMSVLSPKYSFPRGRSTNHKQHVDRALFFLVGLLLHALPRCFQYLSERGIFKYFMIRKDTFSPNRILARNFSGYGYAYIPNSIVNVSHRVLIPSTGFTKDDKQSSCPIFFTSLEVSTVTFSFHSWWTSAARLVRQISPESQWTTVFGIVAALIGYKVVAHVASGFRLKRFSQLNACLPVKIMPNPFPWKLRRYFELSKLDANLLDEYLFKKYEQNGLTHGLGTVLTKRVKAISTIESANFQAVLATRFDDWERPAFRAGAARPFLKTGILTLVSYALTRLLFLPILAALFWLKVLLRLTML
jgi:hypothetical protein